MFDDLYEMNLSYFKELSMYILAGKKKLQEGYSVERLLSALGHRCELELVGSQIDVGTSYATAKDGKVFIYDGLGEDITYNYSYTIIDGELTVAKKRPITFVSCDAEILYNGEEYTGANSYKISLENGSMGLATGRADYESVVFTHEPFIDAGTYDNTFDVSILFEGVDVSYNYEITKLEGTVIINRVKIYVYTGSDTKVFDGTALKCEDIHFTCDDLPSTQRIVAETDGEIIYVGTAENTYKLQVYRDDDPVSMDNFILIDELGSLEITPLELHIVSNSDQKTYDGSPLVNKGYTSNWESTEAYAKGELSLGVAITGTRTDVGRSNNTFFARVYEKNGDEVPKGNCIITTETGTLTVYAPPTVFESYDSFGIYDGIDKSYHYAELVEDGVGYVSPEHEYEFLFEGECIDAGTYENRFTVKLTSKETGENVSEFYPDISYIYGTVSISKRVMEIETPKNKYQYTGEIIYAPSEIQTPNNDFNILNSLYDDCEYTWSVDPITDVYVQMSGEQVYYTIPLEKLHIYLNGTELDKSNFEITIKEGYMKVAEKLLTITVYKVVKAYSGKPVSYYADDWRFDATQLPEGYTLDFILEGSLTEVGELDLDELMDELYAKGNVHVYDENGVDVTSSYEFKLAGTPLTVTPRKLQITAGSSEKYYDGTPLTDESYSVTGGSLAKGHEIRSCHVYGSRTDVGTGLNSAGLAVIVDKATGEIVTDNYEIDYQYGYLTVLEAEQ